MINRALIRTRCLQMAYAYQHSERPSDSAALEELQETLDETYDLYLHFLQLIPDLTDLHRDRLEMARQKHLPTAEDRNPNMHLADNELSARLVQSKRLAERAMHSQINWRANDTLLRHLLKKILNSSIYKAYVSKPADFAADRAFWADAFRKVIAVDNELAEHLEDQSLFWDNQLMGLEKIEVEEMPDIEQVDRLAREAHTNGQIRIYKLPQAPVEVVKEFVCKTLRRAESDKEIDESIMPQYRDGEDSAFGKRLFKAILEHEEDTRELVDRLTKNWDSERLANMDMLILQMAMAEIKSFDDIPTGVIINEYIELSKLFSTPKSSLFVNGILDAAAKELRPVKAVKKGRPRKKTQDAADAPSSTTDPDLLIEH